MRLLKLLFITALLAFPLIMHAAQQEQAASGKAKTIDELAAMYDVSKCKECHVREYEEWSKSLHAKSLIGTPRTMATIRTTITDGLMKEQKKSGVKEVKDIQKKQYRVLNPTTTQT